MKTYQTNSYWEKINELLPSSFQIQQHNLPVEETWDWNGNKIHLDRYPNASATYRIFLHHGVGTNGRQLNMIFGHKMAALGYDVVAIDNLGFGMTEVNQKNITYEDWVHCYADFVNAETKRDYKKPILYGLSAGGMLTYNASYYIKEVYGIIGMCFLKNDDKIVGDESAKYKGTNWFVIPLSQVLSKTFLRRIPISMKAVSKMNALVNNKTALDIFLQDPSSAANKVQLKFISGYMTYKSKVQVQDFDKCPILLTQPAADKWTPLFLSEISMKGIKAPFEIKFLEDGSHYPMEEKALIQLIQYADEFIKNLD